MSALEAFGQRINDHAELFAAPSSSSSNSSSADLQTQALAVIRSLIDPHLSSEKTTIPLFQDMLQTIGSARPTTRSASKARADKREKLTPTPLSALYVPEEQPNELVWQQLCMRLDTLQGVLGQVLGRQMELGEEAASDPELETGEGGQQVEVDSEKDSESDEDESGNISEASSLDEAEAQETSQPLNQLHSSSPPPSPIAVKTPVPKARKGKASPVDDAFFNLQDFLSQADAGEAEMAKRLDKQRDDGESSEEEEDDVDLFASQEQEDDQELDGAENLQDMDNITYNDFFAPPAPTASTSAPPKASKASPSNATTANSNARRRSIRFNDVVRVKPIRSRKNPSLEDEDEGSLFQRLLAGGPISEDDLAELERLGVDPKELLEDEDEGDESDDFDEEAGDDLDAMDQDAEDDSDGEDANGMDVDGLDGEAEEEDGEMAMDRLKSDLFDEDPAESDGSEAEAEDPNLSRYERRQRALSRQIAELEASNVGKKDWVLSGEARAKDRPLNSLLEEDLEFEHTGKAKPSITSESVASLEERIKQRILDNDWDDVERRLPVDIAKMMPSKLLDVSAEPGKSLGEVFEAQHLASMGQGEDLDEPTKKKHKEISELFDGICGKLDALSNARYTPKAPQTSIQTTSNVSAVSMEDAQPTSTASGSLLAPEEVYKGKTATPTNKGEMSSSEKKSIRRKNRRARSGTQKRVQELVDAKSGGKEQARKELIGHRGVTVLGKPKAGGKKGGKMDKKADRVHLSNGVGTGDSYKL